MPAAEAAAVTETDTAADSDGAQNDTVARICCYEQRVGVGLKYARERHSNRTRPEFPFTIRFVDVCFYCCQQSA